MKSLKITNILLLVSLFALIQSLATTSTSPMDYKDRPRNCLKRGKRISLWLFRQRMVFSFVKTLNAFAAHEKKEVYSQIPWNGERDIIYLIFLNHRVWNGNLKHFSTMHPSFLNLHPFTFPPPLTFLYFTLCLLFSKYRNEPLVTLPLTTVPLNILISTAKNCAELHKCAERISGVYSIDPDGSGPFKVYCDQTTAGGGWTVFQRRLDGCLDFNRDWADYKHGFGNFLLENIGSNWTRFIV